MRTGTGGLLTWEQGTREQSRLSVHLPAILLTAEGTRRVTLVDLSLRGARCRTVGDYIAGQQAVLQWLRFEALGVVTWRQGEACGLTFSDPIGIRDLLDTRDFDLGAPQEFKRETVRRAASAFVRGGLRL